MSLERLNKTIKILNQENRHSGKEFNLAAPKYDAEKLVCFFLNSFNDAILIM
jgi:hypothetical protein